MYDTSVQNSHPDQGNVCWNNLLHTKMRAVSQTLAFLEGTKMYRMHSKIAMLNILKVSLSLKMSNVYISNDRIMVSIRIIILSVD